MGPSAVQIERVAATLAHRLIESQVLEPTVAEEAISSRFTALLKRHFEEEAEIAREAAAEAERLVRQGAPGVRREDLDLRRVEQLVKQRIARERGFPL
jgi:hypothetical protein